MKPKLIDQDFYQKLNQRIHDTVSESIDNPEYNYFNIVGIFFIILIPAILYYRYTTKKKRTHDVTKYKGI
jgi:hypothetical protein